TSGRGIASGSAYHLPLASGGIATLRLSTGEIVIGPHVGDNLVPGNLVSANGRLIFQSATQLAGFAPTDVFETRLREAGGDELPAAVLALRGEARLHAGKWEEGLDD